MGSTRWLLCSEVSKHQIMTPDAGNVIGVASYREAPTLV
jgi:hypothetical protein